MGAWIRDRLGTYYWTLYMWTCTELWRLSLMPTETQKVFCEIFLCIYTRVGNRLTVTEPFFNNRKPNRFSITENRTETGITELVFFGYHVTCMMHLLARWIRLWPLRFDYVWQLGGPDDWPHSTVNTIASLHTFGLCGVWGLMAIYMEQSSWLVIKVKFHRLSSDSKTGLLWLNAAKHITLSLIIMSNCHWEMLW